MIIFNPLDWYWSVSGSQGFYSSKRAAYVAADDATFLAWTGVPTKIDSEASLWEVLRANNVPPYHLVASRTIVDRLQTAGKLAAARTALDAAPIYTRERWNSRTAIYADDPDAKALLVSIGADPNSILAPE